MIVTEGPVRMPFRADVEGMRAVAVLLVMAFHARLLGCTSGFIGVDVFFVLSGYLITKLLLAEEHIHGRISLVRFYARRIRRLLPASLLMMAATVAAGMIILPTFEQASLSRTLLAASTYASNLYFIFIATDYFSADLSSNPLLHTWSLAVEEQFYFLWPLLIVLILRVRRGALTSALIALAVVSFAASLYLTSHSQPYAFYLMPARAWEFAIGGVATQVPPLRRFPKTNAVIAWLSLATIILAGWLISPTRFPGAKIVPVVLATAALLIAGGKLNTASRLLSHRILRTIGQRSYALYLWHWPILILASILAPAPLSPALRVLCLVSAALLSEVTRRLVENPIRSSRWLQVRPLLTIGSAAVFLAMGVTGSIVWRHWAVRTPSYQYFGSAMADLPNDPGCINQGPDATLHPCTFGADDSTKTIALMGDSHIEQWLPAFEEIAKEHRWKIVMWTKLRLSRGSTFDLASEWGRRRHIVPGLAIQSYRSNFTHASLCNRAFKRDMVLQAGSSRNTANVGRLAHRFQSGLCGNLSFRNTGRLYSRFALS
jgi:peptidoglycan/LPS O-acetylase OafA/YrhL